MERRTLSLAAAALLATAPATLASTQAEMEQLITFLQSRIATEDPTLTEALQYRALLESLEMMGVVVPPALRTAAPKPPGDLANALVRRPAPGAPPPTRPAGLTVVEAANPFEAVPPAGSPRPEATSRPTPPATPASPEIEPGLSEVGPDPIVVPENVPRAARPRGRGTVPVDRGRPAPQPVRSPRAFSVPPIARMARELLANPGSNPWKPQLKPVGQDRSSPLGPAPASVARPTRWRAPQESDRASAPVPALPVPTTGPRTGVRERLRQLLGSRDAAAQPAPRRAAEPSIQDLRAQARAAVAAAASESKAERAPLPEPGVRPPVPDLTPTSELQNQAVAVLAALRESPAALAPEIGLSSSAAAFSGAARDPTHADQPRVAVAPGSVVEVRSPGGAITTLSEGRHPVGWNSEVRVGTGGRAMVVYPSQGTIFRIQSSSEGRLEARGVRRLSGSVERFLGRPDDGLQVLDQDPNLVPAPEVNVAPPGLPRLELPQGARASVHFDGLARSLGPGHHVLDWNSLVRVVEGDSARIVYPVTEKVYNFAGSAEGYVETTGVRPRSGQIQSESL